MDLSLDPLFRDGPVHGAKYETEAQSGPIGSD